MNLRWNPEDIIPVIEEQERDLVFGALDHDAVWDLGSLVVGIARMRELPIAVAIDFNGQRAFQAGLPGSTDENDSWINRKVRTVREFRESSFLVGRRFEARGESPDAELDTTLYAGHGGGFPLHVRAAGDAEPQFVGVLVISGLPQEDDHALAVECIRLFLDNERSDS
jgi:uncharacterized protein (UPF0303 family)